MASTLPKRITKSPDVLFRVVGDEGVLLNLESEQYYVLDDVGLRMWQLLVEHGDVVAVAEQFLAEYEVDEETLHRDLAHLIAELADAGLLVVET